MTDNEEDEQSCDRAALCVLTVSVWYLTAVVAVHVVVLLTVSVLSLKSPL